MLIAVSRVMMVRTARVRTVSEGAGCTGMIVDRTLIPDSMVIPGSSG